ncbi:hypothetical protein AXK12_01930 [Cephaloticoccus capnophilus]|uniref:Invasion protein n=1 Tax=Cephaloticoccus capnophilus TaxID=1548208 RepID=A0A139SS92_9BACT|nr:hypothetical protein [Cephaloticoccus capnophilus]KXU37384.1 hypothetical protein AXK12_01930 [Cephaloticoccus capnophilus]
MSAAELHSLHILHVFAVFVLIGTTFFACAGPAETRKRVLMWSGIASLVVLLTGFRLWQGLYGMAGMWAVVKLVCWLGLSAFGGVAYRRREKAKLWLRLTLVFAAIALVMVYLKPF